jgi:hypothetical protein
MNPSEIRRLVETSKNLDKQSARSPEAFLIAFVAWETLKTRILMVGFCNKGLTARDARTAIKEGEAWKAGNYNKIFLDLFGYLPENATNVGKLFRSTKASQQLRNRYVHGAYRVSPDTFRRCTKDLISVVSADWDSNLAGLLAGHGVVPGTTNPTDRLARNNCYELTG